MNYANSEAIAIATAAAIPIYSGWACRFGVVSQDGLAVCREAVVEALPGFLARGASVHEMHGTTVVGRVLSTKVSTAGLFVQFVIADDRARSRVQSQRYRALSLGFKFNRARDVVGNSLIGFDLEEISIGPTPSCAGSLIIFSKPTI